MTYRYVVYDIQKSFNASFDDADFTFNQILYWVTLTANRMRLQQNLATNSDLFTSTFSSLSVSEDTKGRKYIDLPMQIMDLPNNAGVVYITGHKFDGLDVNRIYLLGVECVPVESIEISIKASLDPRYICDLDEQIPLPDEMIFDLTNQVLQLGRFIMMMPSERVNTGEDESEVDYRALYYQQRNANSASANNTPSQMQQE